MNPCECGCGKEVNNRFVRGHHMKDNHFSEETKRKLSVSQKGKPKTEEHRRNISIGKKGKHFSQEHRQNLSLSHKGKLSKRKGRVFGPLSEETRHKLSLAHLRTYRNGRIPSNLGKHPSEETRRKIGLKSRGRKSNRKGKKLSLDTIEKRIKTLKERKLNGYKYPTLGRKISLERREKIYNGMLKHRKLFKDTKIELKVQEFLNENNIQFKTNNAIPELLSDKYKFHRFDIIIPEKKVLIECDGDYWHKYPTGTEWDKEINNEVKNSDWKILRFWEHDIHNNFDYVSNEILNSIKN